MKKNNEHDFVGPRHAVAEELARDKRLKNGHGMPWPYSIIAVLILLFMFFMPVVSFSAEEKMSRLAPKVGEKVTFNIRKMGFNIGIATLEYLGSQEIDGKTAVLIIFTAKAAGFFDQEKIYFDPLTFYPLKNFRDLSIFGNDEKIEETYFPDEQRVVILNRSNGKEETVEYKKNVPIDNIYGVIYRYRQQGKGAVGDKIAAVLPTKDVAFEVKKKEIIKFRGEAEPVLFMEGEPKNFAFWFSSDERRIPLRIKGALGAIKAIMEFKSYSETSGEN